MTYLTKRSWTRFRTESLIRYHSVTGLHHAFVLIFAVALSKVKSLELSTKSMMKVTKDFAKRLTCLTWSKRSVWATLWLTPCSELVKSNWFHTSLSTTLMKRSLVCLPLLRRIILKKILRTSLQKLIWWINRSLIESCLRFHNRFYLLNSNSRTSLSMKLQTLRLFHQPKLWRLKS